MGRDFWQVESKLHQINMFWLFYNLFFYVRMMWKEQNPATLQKTIVSFQMKTSHRRKWKVTEYTWKEYSGIMDTRTWKKIRSHNVFKLSKLQIFPSHEHTIQRICNSCNRNVWNCVLFFSRKTTRYLVVWINTMKFKLAAYMLIN